MTFEEFEEMIEKFEATVTEKELEELKNQYLKEREDDRTNWSSQTYLS